MVIFTNVPVHISGDAAELWADSLTYDLNADKIVLTGNVAAAISRDFAPLRGLGKPQPGQAGIEY